MAHHLLHWLTRLLCGGGGGGGELRRCAAAAAAEELEAIAATAVRIGDTVLVSRAPLVRVRSTAAAAAAAAAAMTRKRAGRQRDRRADLCCGE